MAYDYALVHVKFTIPLAILLTVVLRPLLTRVDLYKTLAIICIAFFSTLPWDSYLIRTGIWSYPQDAVLGPRLFSIPIEELFFFAIQTYITALLYILTNKPVLHAQYITTSKEVSATTRWLRLLGQAFLITCIISSYFLVRAGGEGTYLGLILGWACPFALLTWTMSGYFILQLPLTSTAVPILLPTIYLWLVDELALGRGTWSIETGTKLGWCLFGSLELEEAVFFLVTNSLIVFGLVAFDRGLAILYAFPELYPSAPACPTPRLILRALFTEKSKYDMGRIRGLRSAVKRLRAKSRSFFLASSTFSGRLRIDLVLLYSFCRVADDLVDDAPSESAAREWIQKLRHFLHLVYSESRNESDTTTYVKQTFPSQTWSAFTLLPVQLIPKEPLFELLDGFEMDLAFSRAAETKEAADYPIKDDEALELYAERVASTVGEACLHLVFHHGPENISEKNKAALVEAARTMGHALQYVNIARDILVDSRIDRVYLPTTWLEGTAVKPADVISGPNEPVVEGLRQKLLNVAFSEYTKSRQTMELLPDEVRRPLVVAVESYMEIGRVLREKKPSGRPLKKGRATVPKARRIWVAWRVLSSE